MGHSKKFKTIVKLKQSNQICRKLSQILNRQKTIEELNDRWLLQQVFRSIQDFICLHIKCFMTLILI